MIDLGRLATERSRPELAGVAPGPDDVMVGISTSGRTPYAPAALRAARTAGAAIVGIANNAGTALGALADVSIELLTGPEIVAGSTRTKAVTSRKLVLTTLSTAVMVRLGKVYRNLMVDAAPAGELLARSGGRIRAALHAGVGTS